MVEMTGDERDPAHGDRAEPRVARRDRPRDIDVRRGVDRVGGDGAPALGDRVQDRVRDALPRTHAAGRRIPALRNFNVVVREVGDRCCSCTGSSRAVRIGRTGSRWGGSPGCRDPYSSGRGGAAAAGRWGNELAAALEVHAPGRKRRGRSAGDKGQFGLFMEALQ